MSHSEENRDRALLSGRYKCPDGRWALNFATLYPDRIVFSNWKLWGLSRREIALEDIEHVEWWSMRPDLNLGLFLRSGEEIYLQISGAGNWKYAIEARLPEKPGSASPQRPPDLAAPRKSEAA